MCRHTLSVYAFGTGEASARIFRTSIFRGRDERVGVSYQDGRISAILKIENPAKYCANIDATTESTHLFTASHRRRGRICSCTTGHLRQETVRERRRQTRVPPCRPTCYFKAQLSTCVTDHHTGGEEEPSVLVRATSSGDFLVKIRKVYDQPSMRRGTGQVRTPKLRRERMDRYFAMNFADRIVSMTNLAQTTRQS